jgi:hypothetical protein
MALAMYFDLPCGGEGRENETLLVPHFHDALGLKTDQDADNHAYTAASKNSCCSSQSTSN